MNPGSATQSVPAGVRSFDLSPHPDHRGVFTEIFRESWGAFAPVQWNAVSSRANVLRGVHVHVVHWDYLLLVAGRALVALHDLRRGSPTEGESSIVELNSRRPRALVIPPGVAHGFYFPEDSIHVYAVSAYWNESDELGCHWADPGLGLDWPVSDPELSERDATAGSLRALNAALSPHQPILSWQDGRASSSELPRP